MMGRQVFRFLFHIHGIVEAEVCVYRCLCQGYVSSDLRMKNEFVPDLLLALFMQCVPLFCPRKSVGISGVKVPVRQLNIAV